MTQINQYKRPGKNGLRIYDDKDGAYDAVIFEIEGEFKTSPLTRPKVRELVQDLQAWLDKGVSE